MSPKIDENLLLRESFADFILSRQAIQASPKTITTYKSVLGRFIKWLESEGIKTPGEVTARLVRSFMAGIHGKPWTINGYARAIRTLLIFWEGEGYLPEKIKVEVPGVKRQKLPFLTADQITRLLELCSPREKALVLFLVDTGLRRFELSALNWNDIDLDSGRIHVNRGKGNKYRLTRVGATARRALLTMAKKNPTKGETAPVFQTPGGDRLTGEGIQSLFRRLSDRAGVKVSAHMLRRSFATLSLRAGMNLVVLQSLMGHSSIETTRGYIQLLDSDLLEAHEQFSPIDNLKKIR